MLLCRAYGDDNGDGNDYSTATCGVAIILQEGLCRSYCSNLITTLGHYQQNKLECLVFDFCGILFLSSKHSFSKDIFQKKLRLTV